MVGVVEKVVVVVEMRLVQNNDSKRKLKLQAEMSGSNDMHAQTYAKTHARPWEFLHIENLTVVIHIQNIN